MVVLKIREESQDYQVAVYLGIRYKVQQECRNTLREEKKRADVDQRMAWSVLEWDLFVQSSTFVFLPCDIVLSWRILTDVTQGSYTEL
jgi:hypothetical protein